MSITEVTERIDRVKEEIDALGHIPFDTKENLKIKLDEIADDLSELADKYGDEDDIHSTDDEEQDDFGDEYEH